MLKVTQLIGFAVGTVAPAEGAVGALALLTGETDGFAIDATTYDSITAAAYTGGPVGGTVAVINTGDTGDNLSNVAIDASNLTNSGTSAKMVRWDTSPYIRWAPHNLFLQSQAWATSPWAQTGGVTATNNTGDVTDPLGGSTATKLVSTAAADNFCLQTRSSLSQGGLQRATFSFWARTASGSATVGILFDNESHSAEWTPVASTTASITSTWQRFTYSGSVTSMETVVRAGFGGFNAWTTGDTIYVWGAQLNYGLTALPYISTTSAGRAGIPQGYDTVEASYGILIEPSITNLITRSEDITGSGWGNQETTDTANTDVSPDGNTTGDTLTCASGLGAHNVFQAIGNLSTTHTVSIHAKAGTHNYLYVTWLNIDDDENHIAAVFDLSNGTVSQTDVGATTGTLLTTSCDDAGGGWYRCRITGSGSALDDVMIGMAQSASSNTFSSYGEIVWTAAGTETIKLWGAQMEAGAVLTSYVPTGSASITRAADNVAALTSSFAYGSANSAYVSALTRIVSEQHDVLEFDANNSNEDESVKLYTDTSANILMQIEDGGSTQLAPLDSGVNASANTLFQVTGAWASNDVDVSADGTTATSDGSATMPTVTHLRLGCNPTPGNHLNGWIYKVVQVPRQIETATGDIENWRYEA